MKLVASSDVVPVVTASGARTNLALAPHARDSASDQTSQAAGTEDDDTFEIAISNAAAAAMPEPAQAAQPAQAPQPEPASTSDSALLKGGDNADAQVPSGPLPMFGATVLQHVRDFDAWRAAFEATLPERKHAGFVAQGVMRGVDDPRLVAVWLAVTDVAQAKAYFNDKSVSERMSRAGATGRPRVLLSSNLTAKMEPGRTGLHAAILRMRVNDVAVFKAIVDTEAQDRQDAGIVGYALGQDVDDPSLAYLYLQSEDAGRLRNYVFGKQTKQSWRDAGMQGNPILTIVKEEELALCQ